jgi:hypothetical protein
LTSSFIHHPPAAFLELNDEDRRLNTPIAVYSRVEVKGGSDGLLLLDNKCVDRYAPILNRLQFVHVDGCGSSVLLVVLPVQVEVQLGSVEEGGGGNICLPRGGPVMLNRYETRVYKATLVDGNEMADGEGSIRLEQIHFPPLPTSYEELVS